jgi:hypothetical protein
MCMYVYVSHTLHNVKAYMLTSLQLTWQLIAMLLVIESEIHLEHLWSKHVLVIQDYEFMMQY